MKSILKSAFINEDFIITLVGFTPLVFSGVDLFGSIWNIVGNRI